MAFNFITFSRGKLSDIFIREQFACNRPAKSDVVLNVIVTVIELPRREENNEFECLFFRTGETNLSQILKVCFYAGNLTEGTF